MGVYYTLHCEAMINGEWMNIDPIIRTASKEQKVFPVIHGQSFVGGALNWHELLSTCIDPNELDPVTLAYHNNDSNKYNWRVFDYVDFYKNRDFKRPEYAGYFQKEAISYAKEEGSSEILVVEYEEGKSLKPIEFSKLSYEAQKGFEYMEFTEPFSYHDVMRRIQIAVEERLRPYDDLDGPVRIVIYIS